MKLPVINPGVALSVGIVTPILIAQAVTIYLLKQEAKPQPSPVAIVETKVEASSTPEAASPSASPKVKKVSVTSPVPVVKE